MLLGNLMSRKEDRVDSSRSELESRPEETNRALELESTSGAKGVELCADKIESGANAKEATACVI